MTDMLNFQDSQRNSSKNIVLYGNYLTNKNHIIALNTRTPIASEKRSQTIDNQFNEDDDHIYGEGY